METSFLILAIVLLLAALAAGWMLTLLGLPGNWVLVLAAAAYAAWAPTAGSTRIGWAVVGGAAALAAAGEIAEMVASMWGARRAGGSRRAALFSLLGSLGGALVGAVVGIPIPVIGSALAAMLGGACGALAGAALAERTRGENARQSLRVGTAAFWGRLLGTGAKTLVASILVVLLLAALVV